jgi:hypothetical protein
VHRATELFELLHAFTEKALSELDLLLELLISVHLDFFRRAGVHSRPVHKGSIRLHALIRNIVESIKGSQRTGFRGITFIPSLTHAHRIFK